MITVELNTLTAVLPVVCKRGLICAALSVVHQIKAKAEK